MELNCIKKEIEDSIFNFIDDELKSIHALNVPSRTVVYNEVVNFVEDKIISLFENEEYDVDEVVIENEELGEQVYNLQNGFEELKSNVADDFESIQSYLEDALRLSYHHRYSLHLSRLCMVSLLYPSLCSDG